MPFKKDKFEDPIEEPLEEPLDDPMEPMELGDDEEITNTVSEVIAGVEGRNEKINAAIAALEGMRDDAPGLGGLGDEGLGLDDLEEEY